MEPQPRISPKRGSSAPVDANAAAALRARRASGLTQKLGAKALGLALNSLGRYERGEREIPLAVAERMENAYGVAPGSIRTPIRVVPITSSVTAPAAPLSDHVLISVGRISELAELIQQLSHQTIGVAERQRGIMADLGQRAEYPEGRPMDDMSDRAASTNDHPGIRIRARREELGMTQATLARATNLRNAAAVSRIELGIVRDIDTERQKLFATALKTTKAKLFTKTDSRSGRRSMQ